MQSDDSGSRSTMIKLGIAIVLFIGAGTYAYYSFANPIENISIDRAFICSEEGKVFEYSIKMGDTIPVMSPYTDRKTGYPAEKCYWTKDENGRWAIKEKPTFVLIKKYVDPDTTEKTYCPDCGREVVPHNPIPTQKDIDRANESGE